jgi:hypothetical protein
MTAARRDGSIIAFAAIAVVVLAARSAAARSSSWSLRKRGGPSAQMWIR